MHVDDMMHAVVKVAEQEYARGLANRSWVGLTADDIHEAFNFVELVKQISWDREPQQWCENFAAYIETKLRDKNRG